MKNLFEERAAEEVKVRLARLRPDSGRLWGRMDAAQAVAHCAAGLELAPGERRPPQTLFGRPADCAEAVGKSILPVTPVVDYDDEAISFYTNKLGFALTEDTRQSEPGCERRRSHDRRLERFRTVHEAA